jgi:hypothetical protein
MAACWVGGGELRDGRLALKTPYGNGDVELWPCITYATEPLPCHQAFIFIDEFIINGDYYGSRRVNFYTVLSHTHRLPQLLHALLQPFLSCVASVARQRVRVA